MRIESGSTSERRTRILLFLLMCTAFAAWFAYDGLVGYPRKNLEWAKSNLPDAPAGLATNPKAAVSEFRQITEKMKVEDVKRILGEPALVQPRNSTHLGAELTVTVEYDDQERVARVRSEKTEKPPEQVKDLVTRDRVERVKPGMTAQQVLFELGAPTKAQEKTLWYVGPAAFARFEVKDGAVSKVAEIRENLHKTERDIRYQKVIAVALAVVALVTAFKLWQVVRTRAVLDEDGLNYNGRRVAWDAMSGLVIDQYRDKGWVDLEFKANGSAGLLRIDCYHIDRFREIIAAICERKGFTAPFRQPAAGDGHN